MKSKLHNDEKLNNDIISAFDEISIVLDDVYDLNKEELVQCRKVMINRLQTILEILGKYVSDEEVNN